ncbi:MAG: alpha-L-fucosidase [Victivallales bacterium]
MKIYRRSIMVSTCLDWFRNDRFGMFIHWGLYSLPGGIWKGEEMDYVGEWIQSHFRIPRAEYETLASQFNPAGFDADEWVETAKAAGMRYIVFTAKHHDGFAMYHSKCSSFNVVDSTPFGRDILAELAAACGKHGLKLGVYYSQDLDWHDPDGGDPGSDFPKNFGMSWGNDWDFPDHASKVFSRYFNGKVIPQITELLSGYGPISLVWFDCPTSISREDSECLASLVRRLQPGCLINTRLGNGLGDYGSLGDNQLPSARRDGVWETPGTLNDTWGFKHNDLNWKTASDVIQLLAGLADKDTNYLLNVGPQLDGRFPPAALGTLRGVGRWLDMYGEGIYRSRGNPFPYDFGWGYATVRLAGANGPTRLNLFLREIPDGNLAICGLKDRVLRCYDLANQDNTLPFSVIPTAIPGIDTLRIELGALSNGNLLPAVAVQLDTTGYPTVEQKLIAQDGTLLLMGSLGKLHHGRTDPKAPAVGGVAVTGERLLARNHCFMDETGAIAEWHSPDDSISWDIVFIEEGSYKVEFVTSSRMHSSPWTGGQTVRLSYEDGNRKIQWDAKLHGNVIDTTASRCYAQGISSAGDLAIRQPSAGTLRISVLDPGDHRNLNMALNEIRLIRRQANQLQNSSAAADRNSVARIQNGIQTQIQI